jgi:hypothetical protein
VKSYLRYELKDTFGVIATPNGEVCPPFLFSLFSSPSMRRATLHLRSFARAGGVGPGVQRQAGVRCVAGECLYLEPQARSDGGDAIGRNEQGMLFQVARLHVSFAEPIGLSQSLLGHARSQSEALSMALSPNGVDLAVGYADGRIRVWHMPSRTLSVTLNGHRAAVTALRYNSNGSLLLSGSKDTDIVLWDSAAEVLISCEFLVHDNRVFFLCAPLTPYLVL